MISLGSRVYQDELMDDLDRPEQEFSDAYRELEIINRRLGGIRAIERFLPSAPNLLILDVAAGACDVSEALAKQASRRIVALDRNDRGLKRARKSMPVVGDALDLPFADNSFDVVIASLVFHHLSNEQCRRALAEMWRLARRMVLVNDLHRHPVAYWSIRVLTAMFSRSVMVRNDGPLSVRRAFKGSELMQLGRDAGVPCQVYRSFPYRLVLVARK